MNKKFVVWSLVLSAIIGSCIFLEYAFTKTPAKYVAPWERERLITEVTFTLEEAGRNEELRTAYPQGTISEVGGGRLVIDTTVYGKGVRSQEVRLLGLSSPMIPGRTYSIDQFGVYGRYAVVELPDGVDPEISYEENGYLEGYVWICVCGRQFEHIVQPLEPGHGMDLSRFLIEREDTKLPTDVEHPRRKEFEALAEEVYLNKPSTLLRKKYFKDENADEGDEK